MDDLINTFSNANSLVRTLAIFTLLLASPVWATQDNQAVALSTPALTILEEPSSCSMAVDRTKRVFQLGIAGLENDDVIRFRTQGPKGRSVKIKVAKLLSGEIQLPSMSITGQFADREKLRGLWAMHDASGQKVQLSYLPGYRACNSKGVVIVSYRNVWVKTTRNDS